MKNVNLFQMKLYKKYDSIVCKCLIKSGEIGGHCHATPYKKTCIEWRV